MRRNIRIQLIEKMHARLNAADSREVVNLNIDKRNINRFKNFMIGADWEDINKLDEQNKNLRILVEQQEQYIKALRRSIPSALLEDLEPHLPALPEIPQSLDLHEPQRMLKNPVKDSQPLFKFLKVKKGPPKAPSLPPTPVDDSENSGFSTIKRILAPPTPILPPRDSSLHIRAPTVDFGDHYNGYSEHPAKSGESSNHNKHSLNLLSTTTTMDFGDHFKVYSELQAQSGEKSNRNKHNSLYQDMASFSYLYDN
jgi:hypothetical protein